MKKIIYVVLIFLLHHVFAETKEEVNTTALVQEISDALRKYLTNLSGDGALDFTVILSRNQYYDDGSVQQVDTLAFASKAEDDTILEEFNLKTLSKTGIKKLVADAKKNGVQLSLYQESTEDDKKSTTDFDTTQPSTINSAAANVVLHPKGFVAGLEEEIGDAMDLTDNIATIQLLEYFKEGGGIKRNITTTVHSNKVNVVDSYKMTPRMIQGASELLRKAYKIDMDDRTTLIGQLFEKEYPRYTWKVFENSTAHVTKKSVSATLITGQDKYDIVGVLKR